MKAIYTILGAGFLIGAAIVLGLGFSWEPVSGAGVCEALPVLERHGCRAAAEATADGLAALVRRAAMVQAAIMAGVAAALIGVSMLAPKT